MRKIINFVSSALITCLVIMNFVLGFFWPNGFYYTALSLAIVATLFALSFLLGLFFKEEEEEKANPIIRFLIALLVAALTTMNIVFGYFWKKGFYHTYSILGVIALIIIVLWLISLLLLTLLPKRERKERKPRERKVHERKPLFQKKEKDLSDLTEQEVEYLFKRIREKNQEDEEDYEELRRKYMPEYRSDKPEEEEEETEDTDDELVLPPVPSSDKEPSYDERLSKLFKSDEEEETVEEDDDE